MRLITLISWVLLSGTLHSQNLSVDQIVSKANEAYRYLGNDLKSDVHMDIRDGNGQTIMEREFIVLRKNTGGLAQKWYAYFKQPADIKNMVFMAWKNESKDDDRWLYLPALDLVKRISGSGKRSSFAGSQFTYEDITGRLPQEDVHELTATTAEAYRVKSIPRDPASVEFAYFESWIDKKTFLPVKAVLYDKAGKAYKSFEMLEFQTIQGFPTQTKFSMTNLQNGESTLVTMNNVRYNLGLPENIFSEAFLRRAPRRYLR